MLQLLYTNGQLYDRISLIEIIASIIAKKSPAQCGILPKKCRVAPSPLDRQTSPLRHMASLIQPGRKFSLIPSGRNSRSFHPNGILSGRRPTFPGYLTSGIMSGRRPTFFGYLTAEILSGRRSTFFGYFASDACRRMGEEDDSTSPGRHVQILQ